MDPYPVTFSVDYPDRELNRWTTLLRVFTIIPIVILIALVASGVGVLWGPVLLMLLFRQKYPRWWFDWNLELQRFSARIGVYAFLMDDRYPSTDEEQSVHLNYPYPAEGELNRWLPLVKWLLILPHVIVLTVLGVAAVLAAIGAWFAILFTGRYPRSIFEFVEGVMRWHNRVYAYAFTLVTDKYPPFRMSE